MSNTNVTNPAQIMQVLKDTKPAQIAELDFVRDRYIQNYNTTHKDQMGELMYHRQLVYLKQLINGSEQLKACDPFSIYACIVTAAVNGYSLDPTEDEVYIIPRGGKAYIQKQAGAYVRRLMRTNQIVMADQAVLVYQGDIFNVMNGRVIKHVEQFQSETIIAGYVRMVIDDKGGDRFFIYRRSDWESWRSKSQQKDGVNWNYKDGQPFPGFLRTKIILHACKEKCWASGSTPPNVEQFEDVEIESEDDGVITATAQQKAIPGAINTSVATAQPAQQNGKDFFTGPEQQEKSVHLEDESF